MLNQPIAAKLGEINYRAKIVNQQLGKNSVFKHEPSFREFGAVLKSKLKETERLFKKLQKNDIKLSPYLEVGSEHCLRATLLESKFGATGFATDISLYSLIHAPDFAKQFKFKKVPKRICADAENLPFKSNSFSFVFIYETLHHFPNPKLALNEIYRVLAPGGLCLVGADPIKQSFQISFWRRPTRLRFWEKFLKFILILPFVSHIGKTEVDHGILEGAFPLNVWLDSLSIFNKVELTIKVYPLGPTEKIMKSSDGNWQNVSLATKILLKLFGGGIQALCFKETKKALTFINNLDSYLICPNCLKDAHYEIKLNRNPTGFACQRCHSEYKKYMGVLLLVDQVLKKRFITQKI